jgi:general secretion pathway protein C
MKGRRMVIGAYLALGVFLLAHTVNAFVDDALRVPPIRDSALTSIIPSGLQQAANPGAPPLDVAKKVALIGTVCGPQGGIMAILEDLSTKTQSLYHLGNQIHTVGALSVIEKDRVLFRKGQQEEWLPLALTQQAQSGAPGAGISAPAPRPSAPQRRILDRRDVDAALADRTRLLTHAQAVPYLTDGKLDGFRLYSVMPLGFFDKIGLQTNDLLQRINGVEIRDQGLLLSLFQQLQNERIVRVDIVRDTQRQTLVYEIR